LMLPAQVMAQASCPSDLSVGFVDGNSGPFEIGETVPIQIDFEMGYAPVPETVEISHFQFLLDCEGAVNFADCKAQGGVPGNKVTFLDGSEDTNCVINGAPPGVVIGTSDDVITVDFVVEDNAAAAAAILLDSTGPDLSELDDINSCWVRFDVRVDELSDVLADKEIIEWAGVGATDAVCRAGDSNPVPGGPDEDSLSFFITNPNSIFWVTKDFTDDNASEVDVHFRCDTGTILNSDFSITDPATGGTFPTVGFIVYGIPSTGANCTIYEDPIPSGYEQSYAASARPDADYDDLGELDDDAGCFYDGVHSGEYDCAITNTGAPAMFTVYKDWVVYGTGGGSEVLEKAEVTITCDSEIFPNEPPEEEDEHEVIGVIYPPILQDGDWRMVGLLGDEDFMTAKVDTSEGEASCFATEDIDQSGVESIDDCLKPREVGPDDPKPKPRGLLGPGDSEECTFTNTVFFEGIPTLNQYGMALMALLMLGLGVIGFRRFG